MSSGKFSIDETYINVHLKGGNLHTELLHIEGFFIKGQFKGQSVPLKCSWFNMTKDNDFVEIDEVTGQFYQPCILDIDTKIMVQAIPILDYDYNGMPLMAETNYLQADSKIFDLVNQSYNDGKMQINCKLENFSDTQQELNLPLVCILIINEEGLQLKTDQNLIICNYQKYEMKILKKNNNQIEVIGENSKFLAALTNNLIRDALYQFGKTLKGKKGHLNDTAQIYATITDQEQKIRQLEQEIINMSEQKQKNKQTISDQTLQINQLTKKVEQLEKQLQNNQNTNQNKEKELQALKQNIEKLDGKNQIYIQEIKVLKSQAITLENQNKKNLVEIEELKKHQQQNQDEIREMFYREKLDTMKQQIDKCTRENQQWQLINDQLMKEIKKLENHNSILQEEKELLQNELNSLKKKYESLLQESELNKKKDKSDISSEGDTHSNKISEILVNNQFNQQGEEIKRLKATINNLEITIKNLKRDYEQEMLKFTNKHFLKSNTPQEISALQRLANSLAESLNDKEQALQIQRNINRELSIKIQELSK